MRRDVLDQVTAGRRRRNQSPDYKERAVMKRGCGSGPGAGRPPIARRCRVLKATAAGSDADIREELMASCATAYAWFLAPWRSCWPSARRRLPTRSRHPTAVRCMSRSSCSSIGFGARQHSPISAPESLVQPAGREWREFRNVTLRWIGGVAILGMIAVLVIFYLTRRMVRLESGACRPRASCASRRSSASCTG